MNNSNFRNVAVAELAGMLQRGDLRLVNARAESEWQQPG